MEHVLPISINSPKANPHEASTCMPSLSGESCVGSVELIGVSEGFKGEFTPPASRATIRSHDENDDYALTRRPLAAYLCSIARYNT